MKKIVTSVLIIFLITSCNKKNIEEVNEEKIKSEVLSAYNNMYNSYAEGTDEFFKYYENDFLRVTTSGNLERGVEKPKIEWNDYLKSHSVDLKNFSEPEIIISPTQVVTIGNYTEYFINRETKDSTYNKGVYIGIWRQQKDKSWKICMDTWHSGLE